MSILKLRNGELFHQKTINFNKSLIARSFVDKTKKNYILKYTILNEIYQVKTA
jgi:hypothetical protein